MDAGSFRFPGLLLAAVTFLWLACSLSLRAQVNAPLTPDPSIIQGELANGVRYLIRQHRIPAGHVLLKLQVDAGSLNEQVDAPGAAFTTARLLHLTTALLPAGRAVASLGEGLQAAIKPFDSRIDFDMASFTVALPIADEKALSIGLRQLHDIAQGQTITDDAVVLHRPDLLRDLQALNTLSDRVMRNVLPKLPSAAPLAAHPPLVSEETLCDLTAEQLRRYHHAWYTPARIQIIAVGDAEPALLKQLIEKEFGDLPARPSPDESRPLVEPGEQAVAIVSDPEIVQGVAEVLVMTPAPDPITTQQLWRDHALRGLATRILDMRLRTATSQPGVASKGSAVWSGPAPGPAYIMLASTTGDAKDWEQLVKELTGEVERARRPGITPEELAAAISLHLNDLEKAVRLEPTISAGDLLLRYSGAASRGDTLLSPAQEHALALQTLGDVRPHEVEEALLLTLEARRAALILLLPNRTDLPTDEEVRAAAAEPVGPHALKASAVAEPDALLTTLPTPGPVLELSVHPPSSVTSAWLASGARVHHRRMTAQANRVAFSIILAGGRIEEAPDERGLTMATAALWESPAAGSLTSAQIQRLLTAHSIELRSWVRPDSIILEFACDRSNLEMAMQLVHLVILEPHFEAAAFERWRWGMLRQLETRKVQPAGAADEALTAVLFSETDTARRALTEAEVRAVTLERAQAWLSKLVARAPIEAAIVGDIERAEALQLASRYLGSITPRERVGANTFCDQRLPQPMPTFKSVRVDLDASPALMLIAIRGSTPEHPHAVRALDIAARVLSVRTASLRDQPRNLAQYLVVKHTAAEALSGLGLLYAVGTADAALVDPLADEVEKIFSELATNGPTEAELIQARAQAVSAWDLQFADPAFWSRQLSSMTYRSTSLKDLLEARQHLTNLTAEQVREVFRAHDPGSCCQSPRLRIVVKPAAPR